LNKRLRSRVLGASLASTSVFGIGGVLSTQVALAQDKPSAAETLDRGSKLYDQKQYAEAKKLLVDVDPAQLPEDLRAKRADLIKNADLELAKASPNGALDAAQADMDGDKLAAAAKGFQAIIDDANAPADAKDKAKLQLALVKEKQAAKAPAMRELLKQAEGLVRDGKLDEAENALTTIEATGADLGWQDAQRPKKLREDIQTARTAAARGNGNTAVATTTTGTTTTTDPGAVVAPGVTNSGTATVDAGTAPAPRSTIAPGSPLADQVGIDQVRREETQVVYRQALDASTEALKTTPPNYVAAIRQAEVALETIDSNRRYFSDAEVTQMRDTAERQRRWVRDQQAAAEARDAANNAIVIQQREGERRKRLAEERHRQIRELTKTALEFKDNGQYRESAETFRRLLVIDPNNALARVLHREMTDKINYREWQRLTNIRATETMRQSIANQEELIPYTDLMVYPENWVELTRNRVGDQSNADSPQNRAVRARLDENLKEISADQNGFERVINFLRDATSTNIFVNWTALQAAGVDRTTPVSVNLREVPFRKALQTILSEVGGGAANLAYTIDDGVITISTRDDLNSARYRVVRVFDIRDMLVQPDNNINPPTFNLTDITKGGTTSGSGGSSSSSGGSGGIFSDTSTTGGGTTTKSRDDIVKEVVDTIKTTVAPESWTDGGGIGSLRELNGQLIVNQTVDNQTAVYNLLAQLRETRALQIAIEARLLLVSNNFLDVVGISWNLGIPAGEIGGNVGAVTIGNNTASLATPGATGVPGSLGASLAGNSALSVTGSIIDNFTLNLIIQATQADKRTVTVTAPRVTLFNGQRGYIAVTQQQNFVSNFNQTVAPGSGIGGSSATGTNLQVSTLTTGVVLYVEATVSADRRYVVMKLRPQLSTLDGLDTFSAGGSLLNPNTGQTVVGGGFVQLPKISYTTVDTMVSVPDGGTLLIGGERLVGESEVEIGVPVLSKIPGLNRLFTNRSLIKDERTLLILVRPKIIIQKEIENDLFGVGYDRPTGLPGPANGGVSGGTVGPGFSVTGPR
jgi:general secretion pathway protein D